MVQPVSTRPLRPLRSIQFPPVLLQSSTAQASALQSQPGESMVSRENRQKPMGLPEFFIWRLHGITDTNSGNAARVRSIYESKVESQTPAVASIQHRRPLSNLSSVFHPASQRVPWYQILNQTNTHYLCIHVWILNIYHYIFMIIYIIYYYIYDYIYDYIYI